MHINITSTKGLSEDPHVTSIVNKVKVNPQVFKFLARIFSDYNNNKATLKEETYQYIDGILDSPKLNLCSKINNELNTRVKSIYKLNAEKFNNVRGAILENVVYHFGPVTKDLKNTEIYIEPELKDNNGIIGGSSIKCDFVFFYKKSYPIEFIECKADIANVIPSNLPFERAKSPHRKKIMYLDAAYTYIKETYSAPIIYFACYNLNYNKQLRNLQENWGFLHMNFVNAEEIIEGKVV